MIPGLMLSKDDREALQAEYAAWGLRADRIVLMLDRCADALEQIAERLDALTDGADGETETREP